MQVWIVLSLLMAGGPRSVSPDLLHRMPRDLGATRLVIPGDHPLYRALEQAWNRGDAEGVRAALTALEETGQTFPEYGIAYLEPRPFAGLQVNGGPIPVSSFLNVREVELVVNPNTGDLIAFLAVDTSASTSVFHVLTLLSTDGGNTWTETYDWSGFSPYKIDAFYGMVSGTTYAYVADIYGTGNARLRRFPFATGEYDAGFGNVTVTTSADTLKELAAFANDGADFGYFLYLHSSGEVEYRYSPLGTPSFGTISTGVTNADRGLSGTYVTGQIGPVLFAYTDATGDTLFVRWRTGGASFGGTFFTGSAYNSILGTSVAALADTVLVTYDTYDTAQSARLIRYRIMYGDTASFSFGTISTDMSHSQRSPRAIQSNGTFAVSWIFYGNVEPDSIALRTRPVGTPSWSTVWAFPFDYLGVIVPDHDLAPLGGGVWGFLAIDEGRGDQAIFMASTWTDVAEPVEGAPVTRIRLDRTVVPRRGMLRLALPWTGRVRVSLLTVTGRQVRVMYEGPARETLLLQAPGRAGVYFLRVEGPARTDVRRFVVLP